jgi:hypothetical protein
MAGLRRIITLFGLAAVAIATLPARAGDEVHPDANPFNPAFATYLGSGIYFVDGRTAYLFRVPVGVRLRSENEHAFGIRLRINAAVGFYDLNLGDLGDLGIPTQVSNFAIVPGVEFPIAIRSNWTFGPFLDLGVSYNNATDEATPILGTGFRSRAIWDKSRLQYLLWNQLVYGNNLNTESSFDDFMLLRTDFDIRRVLNFRIKQRPQDVGLLFHNDVLMNEVVFARPGQDPLVTRLRWEVGFTIGPTEKWKVLKNLITLPRLGLSYRFGDGPGTIRIILTGRY